MEYSLSLIHIEAHQKYVNTEAFRRLYKERYKIEAKNGELKNRYGCTRAIGRGLISMQLQGATAIFMSNIKRILKLQDEKFKKWGKSREITDRNWPKYLWKLWLFGLMIFYVNIIWNSSTFSAASFRISIWGAAERWSHKEFIVNGCLLYTSPEKVQYLTIAAHFNTSKNQAW